MPRPRLEVDRYDTETPAYRQIANQIRAYIQSGEVAPYDQLWSVNDIKRETAVAAMTARHALDLLKQEGWILVIRGRGTFVAPPGQG